MSEFAALQIAARCFHDGKTEEGFCAFGTIKEKSIQHDVYKILWERHGGPKGNNEYGREAFHDINGLNSSLADKENVINVCIKDLEARFALETNIVFIGAGPIGLWTAVCLKVQRKSLNIFMFDKHVRYEREHHLQVNHSSFDGAPNVACIKKIIDEFKKASKRKDKIELSIKKIEEDLKKLALDLGIYIKTGETISEPRDLIDRFRHAKIFIGADGRRSNVRQKIFGESYRFEERLINSIQLHYKVQEEGIPIMRDKSILAPFYWGKGTWRTEEQMAHIVFDETASGEGLRDITVRFSVDSKTFTDMEESHTTPFSLTDPRIPRGLLDSVQLWLGMKEALYGEKRVLGSAKLKTVALDAYASQRCVGQDFGGRTWFLVGDAACGFSFLRGFNVGIQCGANLSKTIANVWENRLLIELSIAAPHLPLKIKSEVTIIEKYIRDITYLADKVRAENLSTKKQIQNLRLLTTATAIIGYVLTWSEERLSSFRHLGSVY